jgi:CheY-like chemotaxis protein
VSLLEIVQSVIESAEPGAMAKDIRLEARLDPDTPLVPGDSDRLQQVVWNLLSNAVKFTARGGRIEVRLERVGASCQLSVSDTGIGIPETFLPRVFDRFSQNDASTTRRFGGLGLGLAISKQLVELHGGTIRAASRGEGRGATFFVELPLVAEPARGDPAPAGRPGADASRPPGTALPRLDGVHVFVVDDEADGRELLRRVLEDQSATVTALSSGDEALSELRRVKPHLIVSDIGMPTMDGYQLMRTFRAGEAKGEKIPAVALTAFADAGDRKRALLAGYQAHLAKPFDVAELLLVAADLAKR